MVTRFHNKHCYKWSLGYSKFYWKNINFIYSLPVRRIMDFNRTELTCYNTFFPYASSESSFFIHSTLPYIHPRLDSWIERKFSDCASGWPVVCNRGISWSFSHVIICKKIMKKKTRNSCKTHYADHMKYEDRFSCIGTHITWMDLIDVQL